MRQSLSALTAAFHFPRRRTSSSSIRAKVLACGLGRKAERPIITTALGNIGANGRATRVRGMMLRMPSVRIAAARCASNSVNNVERPSFTSETKRGKTPNGLSIPRTCGTYSGQLPFARPMRGRSRKRLGGIRFNFASGCVSGMTKTGCKRCNSVH